REPLLPDADDLLRSHLRASQFDAVGFLPQLPKTPEWTESLASLDVEVQRTVGRAPHLKTIHRLCPIPRIPRRSGGTATIVRFNAHKISPNSGGAAHLRGCGYGFLLAWIQGDGFIQPRQFKNLLIMLRKSE